MTAAVLYGKEKLQIEKVALPKIGPRDILIKVQTALTCGTDLKVFRRGFHARMINPPALFGHELAGDIVAVGSEVVKFKPGQRVVAANSAPCGVCFYCRQDRQNLCDDLLFNNGAYAQYIRVPGRIVERNVHEIPAGIGYKEAAMVEPLACVLHGIEDSGVRPGDTVTVIGLGPIGLMFVRLAKLAGANVIAVGRRAMQLERADRMGAETLVTAKADGVTIEAVRAATEGRRGADVVIEAVGTPEAWQLATQMVRPGGTVNFFGGCPQNTSLCLDTSLLHYSELTLKASFHHTPRHIRQGLDVIASGKVNVGDLVIDEAPLKNLLSVFRHMMSHNGHLKTAILPHE